MQVHVAYCPGVLHRIVNDGVEEPGHFRLEIGFLIWECSHDLPTFSRLCCKGEKVALRASSSEVPP